MNEDFDFQAYVRRKAPLQNQVQMEYVPHRGSQKHKIVSRATAAAAGETMNMRSWRRGVFSLFPFRRSRPHTRTPSSAADRAAMWKVAMYDVFANSDHILGYYTTRKQALRVARFEFAQRQPLPGKPDLTGGPLPPGIQDRLFIVPPDGAGSPWQYLGD